MLKVLIADDEEKIVSLISNLVDWQNMDMQIVGIANNGLKAWEMLKELKPDILITDIRMPGYNGLELIKLSNDLDKKVYSIIVSGHDQFEYAKQGIDLGVEGYILKPINQKELNNTLENMKFKIENNYKKQENLIDRKSMLRKSLYNELLLNNKDDVDILGYEQNKNSNNYYRAILFDIDKKIKIPKKIDKLIRDYLMDINNIIEVENFVSDNIVTIINYEYMGDDLLNNLFDFVNTHINITMAVGIEVTDISNLNISVKSANEVIYEKIIYGDNKLYIYSYGKLEENIKKDEWSKDIIKKFDNAIDIVSEDKLNDAVMFFLSTVKNNKFDGIDIYNIILKIIDKFEAFIKDNNIKVNLELVINFSVEVLSYKNINNLILSFGELLNKIFIEIKDNTDTEQLPIKMAKEYMERNYMNHITLKIVSEYVGFSPTYLSALFKKESGENFLEYLSNIRINKAKELLKENNISTAQICEEIGYKDLKHFNKSFKKIVGISPKEYKKIFC